ncbi:MAG: asparagine synthase (glutamine-hydrolyzing) [Deltaproteobacteria bacterium]|nr:MAG: asparagine synthase (glutamine-hydrolyzing) [Deltaproteobacteria bacterium]
MCGISGFLNRDLARPADQALLKRMTDVMAHRGPDGSGLFVEGPAALGHRRLSIIDLSANGAQPMANEDGTVHVTFNGEIYNHLVLREELIAKGHLFRSRCDTEVLVHGYEEWGDALPERLSGMFAFAIWDSKRRRLLFARDRLGKKPVYYHLGKEKLVFASEIKSLLCDPAVPRELDEEALDLYLSLRYVPAGLTAFAQILKLPPASLAVYENGRLSIRRYWRTVFPPEPSRRSDEELAAEFWERLKEATRARLMADVPVGVFLSGGLDSSAIAAHMLDLRREAGEGGVKSFSVGYLAEDGSSELDQARRVARALGTEHREVLVTADDFHAFLPQLVWYMDEPVADAACVPLYYLSKRAREEVVVVLSGEGADEALAGYPIYRTMLMLEQLRSAAGGAMERTAPLMSRLTSSPKARKYLYWSTLPLEERYRGVSCAFVDEEKSILRGDSLVAPRKVSARLLERLAVHWAETEGLPPLERMLELDRRVWLPDDLLVKADKMTMATSVELRVPFLDHRLIEWCARLPTRLKLRGRSGKWILRKAAFERLPPECTAPGKRGFTVPVSGWFRGQLHEPLRETLLDRDAFARARFGQKPLERLLDDHKHGVSDRKEELFALWVLELWLRQHKVGFSEEAPQMQGKRRPRAMSGGLKGRDIVCFSNDWDGDPLSKMHIMKILARDNRVLWVNSIGNRRPRVNVRDFRRMASKVTLALRGIRERHPNIWVLTPLAIPYYGSELVRTANGALLKAQIERAMDQLDFKDVVSWSFLPSSAPVAGTLGESLVVYHCVDEFSAFSDAPGQDIRELERRLLLRSDVVLCSSEKLRDDKARLNANAYLVQHGVDLDHFAQAFDPQTEVPDDLKGAPGPIIGFWGLIADWVDLQLVRHVADAFSGGTVALVGNATTDLKPLQGANNIRLLGRKPYADLPRYAKAFDVALMPFKMNELTLASNPLKVREYLAAGLPVVSTAIPEVERLGVCRIGKDAGEIVREIAAAITAGAGPSEVRAAQVRGEGWEARVEEMEEIVVSALSAQEKAA